MAKLHRQDWWCVTIVLKSGRQMKVKEFSTLITRRGEFRESYYKRYGSDYVYPIDGRAVQSVE